jgi:hypothetical protein
MLLRWLVRTLCTTHAEMRVVLRSLRAYYLRTHRMHDGHDDQDPLWTFDSRVTRSMRLSLLLGLLMVHVENPRLFASAWIVIPLAILLALFHITGRFQ